MGFLKEYITSICVAVFFLTAIELLIPKNNMKKYVKFALGLILMTIIINPIVKVLNNGLNVDEIMGKSYEYYNSENFQNESQTFKEENNKNVMTIFKENFEKSCEEELKKEFPDGEFQVTSDINYDGENNEVEINSVKVVVTENSSKVQRVTINLESDDKMEKSELEPQIKEFLSEELQIEKSKIEVFKS